jgi:hypothetical protein
MIKNNKSALFLQRILQRLLSTLNLMEKKMFLLKNGKRSKIHIDNESTKQLQLLIVNC